MVVFQFPLGSRPFPWAIKPCVTLTLRLFSSPLDSLDHSRTFCITRISSPFKPKLGHGSASSLNLLLARVFDDLSSSTQSDYKLHQKAFSKPAYHYPSICIRIHCLNCTLPVGSSVCRFFECSVFKFKPKSLVQLKFCLY